MAESALDGPVDQYVRRLSAAARASRCRVAVAESLTGGQLAAAISSAEDAGDWFCGGIVAYQPEVKFELLGTPRGPVVTAATASAMAKGAVRLLGADHAVAVTGVGGPGPAEGRPPGTVFLSVSSASGRTRTQQREFAGDPVEVMGQTILAALQLLEERISES